MTNRTAKWIQYSETLDILEELLEMTIRKLGSASWMSYVECCIRAYNLCAKSCTIYLQSCPMITLVSTKVSYLAFMGFAKVTENGLVCPLI